MVKLLARFFPGRVSEGEDRISFLVCVLGSGSAGNSILVCSEKTKLLVDAGLSTEQIESRLERVSIDPSGLSGILISHEHTDHLRSAGVLSRRYNLPIYVNSITYSSAQTKLGRLKRVEIFDPNQRFQMQDLIIEPFSVLHDAADPVGFCLHLRDRKLGIATDLGKPTNLVRQMLRGCHALILEFNHDLEMLMAGPYPWWLKQRIRGEFGHLSNEDAQGLLRELIHQDLKQVILAHLSEKNNQAILAHQAASQVLEERADLGVKLSIASQHQAGEIIEI